MNKYKKNGSNLVPFYLVTPLNLTNVLRKKIISINSSNLDIKNFSCNNIRKNKKEINKKSLLLNYLGSIKEIITNPKYSPSKAQELIENSWMTIIKDKLNDSKFLLNRHSNKLFHLIEEAQITLDSFYENNVIKKKFPIFKDELNKKEYLFLTLSIGTTMSSRLKYTALAVLIGDSISFDIFKLRKKAYEKENKKTFFSFLGFKTELNINDSFLVNLGDFFLSVLSTDPVNLFEQKYITEELDKEYYILKINNLYLEDIKENIIIHPSALPMICKPKLWGSKSFGGFLDNKIKKDSIITGSKMHKHGTENRKPLFKAINYINSIKFEINNLLLNYLNTDGKYLLSEIKPEDELQRAITLKIADVYKNTSFYLNANSDWRGRISVRSFFISYQGGDLASAILNFEKGEKLSESGKDYLYIYGANNHNENNLSKASFSKRINWVNENYEKIINLDKELILSAENPFTFVTFCLTLREIHKNPNSIVKIPIFLDATCNGIQHLSALMQDIELASKVNLIKSNKDHPEDIYSTLVKYINKAINNFGLKNPNFSNLSLVKFTRKILKQSIMTLIYNVTIFGIKEQILSKLEKVLTKSNIDITRKITSNLKKDLVEDVGKVYYAPGKNGLKVILTHKDVFKIASILNEQIFVCYPSLNEIYSYFIDIAKLMVKLGIPISWITPSGLQITQHYLKSKQIKITSFFATKKRKLVLRESTGKMYNRKQVEAIIPNIIHSLDATHLINLINNASTIKFFPLISIHDCFGTHPNKMSELVFMVKREFFLLYSKNKFLETFHARIIQTITDNQLSIKEINSDSYVLFEDYFLKIPKLPKLGKLDLAQITEAKYMIS